MADDITPERIARILAVAGIAEPLVKITRQGGGYTNAVYDIDGRYMLRLSDMADAEERFGRERQVLERNVPGGPRLLATGSDTDGTCWHYLLLTKLAGENLFVRWLEATPGERAGYARGVAALLREVHAGRADHYSIGYHQTALRRGETAWLAGHDAYMRRLIDILGRTRLGAEVGKLVREAEAWYAAHRTALAYTVGPRQLHGDVQLYNVIADGPKISGLIDWEWAHGGEPDFDIADLIRWARYPVHIAEEELEERVSSDDFAVLVPELLAGYPEIAAIPALSERLTIYQIEYDLHKLTQAPETPRLAVARLRGWLGDRA